MNLMYTMWTYLQDGGDPVTISKDNVQQLIAHLRPEVIKLINAGRGTNEIVNTLIGRLLLLETTDGHFQRYDIVHNVKQRVKGIVASLIEDDLREIKLENDGDMISDETLASIDDISSRYSMHNLLDLSL